MDKGISIVVAGYHYVLRKSVVCFKKNEDKLSEALRLVFY